MVLSAVQKYEKKNEMKQETRKNLLIKQKKRNKGGTVAVPQHTEREGTVT